EYVKFKLQLVNANTNNVMGEYTVVTFTKDNITPYFGKSFSINTNGIGNKKVRVRFVAEENINGGYAMANIYAEESVLPKQNLNIISYSGSEVVTEYALEQNYPNPFNPTTTIKYQIPTSGNVTIKVYDVLGNEVVKLVDRYIETGRYEVEFDASSLASGVYIYRLNVNDYVNVKKMVLLK
ncbi:MAG: T9SS type A sorting domain-containing protein, partial [Ignavibacteriaceae bacterium]|nr:T9SS type A sorting domain-containing protein [Ignavibacteriaceae bacterium]